MDENLEHKGTILAVNHGWIDVAIRPETACEGCKIKGACDVGGRGGKIVSVPDDAPGAFREGDEVVVSVSRRMGLRALSLAYVIPLFLLIVPLFALVAAGLREVAAGVLSLGVVGVYYLALWLLRKRVGKEIVFRITKKI